MDMIKVFDEKKIEVFYNFMDFIKILEIFVLLVYNFLFVLFKIYEFINNLDLYYEVKKFLNKLVFELYLKVKEKV